MWGDVSRGTVAAEKASNARAVLRVQFFFSILKFVVGSPATASVFTRYLAIGYRIRMATMAIRTKLLLASCLMASLSAVTGFRPYAQLAVRNPRAFATTLQKAEVLDTQDRKHRVELSKATSPNGGGATLNKSPKIVLVAGFESFNRELYTKAAQEADVDLTVFADTDIRSTVTVDPGDLGANPVFEKAVKEADAFVGSLIFDYDDALVVENLLPHVKGPRLIFESATELMSFNRVGSFSMNTTDNDGPSGPPPAVKAILSKFGSGKEEDKLSGYLKLLKIGPSLLKFVPGEKASDLRTWLEAYRFWNQGGSQNVQAMLRVVADRCLEKQQLSSTDLPDLVVTPDIGLVHPLREHLDWNKYFESPAAYITWRLSKSTKADAQKRTFQLASDNAPRVAVLIYRKHVISKLRYVMDLITIMEAQGVMPIPIFINGVEAHTIVRDLLTSQHEMHQVSLGNTIRDSTYQSSKAVVVDCIVNTCGFPLVGGPAGSMEAGRNVAVAEKLLTSMNVPYIIASPLLLQSIPQWKTNGVLGLQSVALYSLPELDGAIDTIVLGGLVGDKIALVPERVRKLTSRVKGWTNLKRTPTGDRKLAISLYGFPPNVGAVGTAALLDVPRSLDNLLARLCKEGYDLGEWVSDPNSSAESLVAALAILCENSVITGGVERMKKAIEAKMQRARDGDKTVAVTLAKAGGGLGGARVRGKNMPFEELEKLLGKYMTKKVRRAWSEKDRGPGVSGKGDLVVAGLQLGNVWLFVQPLLGVEGYVGLDDDEMNRSKSPITITHLFCPYPVSQ